MFTGCIKELGHFKSLEREGNNGVLRLETTMTREVQHGDSIAVNGACLTVITLDKPQNLIGFNTLDETLKRTNLGQLKQNQSVNLERALQVGDRIDGHFVMGHIDGITEVLTIEKKQSDIVIRMAMPEDLRTFAIVKGSIAINGVSLTIVELNDNNFTVHIIPYTWEHTNLHELKPHDQVNLEMDMLGKYVVSALAKSY
jgi:riboflavin synthase